MINMSVFILDCDIDMPLARCCDRPVVVGIPEHDHDYDHCRYQLPLLLQQKAKAKILLPSPEKDTDQPFWSYGTQLLHKCPHQVVPY